MYNSPCLIMSSIHSYNQCNHTHAAAPTCNPIHCIIDNGEEEEYFPKCNLIGPMNGIEKGKEKNLVMKKT